MGSWIGALDDDIINDMNKVELARGTVVDQGSLTAGEREREREREREIG